MKKKLLFIIIILGALTLGASSHSGRTDSSGGHKDNKNASGLGSYHYHCGGHSAHLHSNGCPYNKPTPKKTPETKKTVEKTPVKK